MALDKTIGFGESGWWLPVGTCLLGTYLESNVNFATVAYQVYTKSFERSSEINSTDVRIRTKKIGINVVIF